MTSVFHFTAWLLYNSFDSSFGIYWWNTRSGYLSVTENLYINMDNIYGFYQKGMKEFCKCLVKCNSCTSKNELITENGCKSGWPSGFGSCLCFHYTRCVSCRSTWYGHLLYILELAGWGEASYVLRIQNFGVICELYCYLLLSAWCMWTDMCLYVRGKNCIIVLKIQDTNVQNLVTPAPTICAPLP
jgi:hypothetical protein